MTLEQTLLLALADCVMAPTQTQTVQARERVRQAGAALRAKLDGSPAAKAIEVTNARLDAWRENARLAWANPQTHCLTCDEPSATVLCETCYLKATKANSERLERSVRQARAGEVVGEPQDSEAAVELSEPPLEADDSRVTDRPRMMTADERAAMERATRELHAEIDEELNKRAVRRRHKCCGGKPDCGCARSVGGD